MRHSDGANGSAAKPSGAVMSNPFTNITAPSLFTLDHWSAAASEPNGSRAQLFDLLTTAGMAAASGVESTLFGSTISGSITVTPHLWVADGAGIYHTPTDLNAEWKGYYAQALAGVSLTPLQHLEANAEAVFENTALNTLDAATQARDREDAQRALDVIAVAMDRAGLSGVTQLTARDYLAIEQQVQSDPTLQELGIQGHGLNSPPSAKYWGYTQDFQNNVDEMTYYVGGGLDNNENALNAFFDDVILTHAPFPTVTQWGGLEQLNQNGDAEDCLSDSVSGLNDAMFNRVYKASDFSQTMGTASDAVTPPPVSTPATSASQMLGYYNTPVDRTITVANAALGAGVSHVWAADGSGLYQLSSATNLAAEWLADYTILSSGTAAQQAALTDVQRLEGNIEGIFLNTGLASLSATQLAVDRMDIQRQLDALSGAMTAAGIGPQASLTIASYDRIGQALQDNADLDELALQGHGLYGTGLSRYAGYTYDLQQAAASKTDATTLYVGGGFDTGEKAVGTLLNDLTLAPFAMAIQDGVLYQFDQNGSSGETLAATVDGLNAAMSGLQYGATAFYTPGKTAPGALTPPAGAEETLLGMTAPATLTIANALLGTTHVWTVNGDGKYVTAADLATEWKGYYQTMLAGNGATLTAAQRWEGNAEAAFEGTALGASTKASVYRMDVQRVIDAASQAMTTLGLGSGPLSVSAYLALSNAVQADPVLAELMTQGQGLATPPGGKYAGYLNDFQSSGDTKTYFVGGGVDNGRNAVKSFLSDYIVGYLADPTFMENGAARQLDANGNFVATAAQAAADLNQTLFDQVYVASDFSKTSTAKGTVTMIAGATPGVAANPTAGSGQIVTASGAVIASTITGLAHGWTADSKGELQTATDLNLEWYNAYQQLLTNPAGMTWLQRAEANAEAIFENTGLAQASEAQQSADRADVQRVLDAVWGAMGAVGLQGKTQLSQQDYVTLQGALRANAQLLELATQGRGLAGGWNTRWSGYENDFRYDDTETLYQGPGLDDGRRAIWDLLDGMIGGDLIFGEATVNGVLTTLDVDGRQGATLSAAVANFNAVYATALTAANFGTPGAQPPAAAPAGASSVTAQDGTVLPASVTLNGHVWTANADGLYATSNLEIEWRSLYQQLLAGGGASMTPWQRLEANAEAVFENSGVMNEQEAQIQLDRMDVQRVIDAEAAAALAAKVNVAAGPLSTANALAIENALQGVSVQSETLEEMMLQGVGQGNNASNGGPVKYDGYAYDFRWDSSPYYVGGGLDNGKSALASFMDDVVLNDFAYGVVMQNGVLIGLNNTGGQNNSVQAMTSALDNLMYRQVLVASDFSSNPKAVGAVVTIPGAPASVTAAALPKTAAAGKIATAEGAAIAATQTLNGHTWVAGSDGLFHTADLSAEWLTLYNQALSGVALTGAQRLEANAEAVFLYTGLNALSGKPGGAAQLQADREDVQRVIDAFAAAEAQDGIGATATLTAQTVEKLDKTIQSSAVLAEFVLQGYGASGAAAGSRYAGMLGDVWGADWSTTYVGASGDYDNGAGAVREFLRDAVLGDVGMPTFIGWDGVLAVASNVNWSSITLAQSATQINAYANQTVLKNTNFSSGLAPANLKSLMATYPAPAVTTLAAPTSGTENTLFGSTVSATISVTPHLWVADGAGIYHTPTDLNAEWKGYYAQALAGVSLTPLQHLEANAEAVFENTALNTLDAATQARDREDAQRALDVIAVAMDRAGLSGVTQLTARDYLAIEQQVQSDPTLQELGIQGHGLNSPPSAKYWGYTQDFQNNVDEMTYYVGGGLDNNENALNAFFDDVILTHAPFPTVTQWGGLEQLNQNGDAEDCLSDSVSGLNDAMFNRVYKASDFSQTMGTASDAVTPPPVSTPATSASQMLGYYNTPVDRTITVANAALGAGVSHVWAADGSGLYQLSSATNLAAEWLADYTILSSGTAAQQAALTDVQRLEGNIEGIFLNTGLASLSATQLAVDRMDIQRQLDALSGAMTAAGIGPQASLTIASYDRIGQALQDNADLDELALQGHGLYGTGLSRYAGYTYDLQQAAASKTDATTLYVGGGFDTGEKAVGTLLNDLTLAPFAMAIQDGVLYQFDQNGSSGETLAATVDGLNAAMSGLQYGATAFYTPGKTAPGALTPPAGAEETLLGMTAPATLTIANALLGTTHVWTVNGDGKYVTAADLATEWKGYYQTMLAGNGATLTAAQRWEGNAEAAFEGTALGASTKASVYRMDVQRVIDAASQAMTTLGLGSGPLSVSAYLALSNAVQADPVLAELMTQGQGLATPPGGKYAGYLNDFQSSGDTKTYFVGGGVDNGRNAVKSFLSDYIVGYLADPTFMENGAARQLDANGNFVATAAQAAADLNQTLFDQVYVASDFSKTSTAKGTVTMIAGATPGVAANPTAGSGQIVTASGAVIASTITGLAHGWTADSKGELQTATDLNLEWYNAYQQLLTNPAGMTWLQRAEANAEAIFENTGLAQASEAQQSADRADVQRVLDAVWGAMGAVGLQGKTQLSQQDYVTLQGALRANAQLLELATQGRGLAGGWNTRWSGYENDFRYDDTETLYQGPGLDDGRRAIWDLLDGMIGGDLIFGEATVNGVLTTLDVDGRQGATLSAAVANFNAVYATALTAANFGTPGAQPPAAAPAGASSVTAQDGTVLPASVTLNGHVWTANADGLYATSNLEIEWRSLYQQLLAGGGASMTPWQRLEANAEAVFENSGVMNEQEAQIQLDRMDVQRVIDAEAAAALAAKVNVAAGPLSTANALAIENALQGVSVQSETLEEMMLQGVGQGNNASNGGPVKYDGYAYDFRWDSSPYYVGGGLDNGKSALASFMDDVVLNDFAYGVVMQNGVLIGLNNTGGQNNSVQAMTSALDNLMYRQVLVASDFSSNPKAVGAVVTIPGAPASVTAAALPKTAAAGKIATAEGAAIAATQTLNGHTWVAGSDGLFHTADLSAEWLTLYNQALSGVALTGAQRLEANAEAVFLYTGLNALSGKPGGAAQLQADREDVQRVIDAFAAAEAQDGIGATATLTAQTVEKLDKTIQSSAVLAEFVLQGYGASGAAAGSRYAGMLGDVWGADWSTTYVGASGDYDNGAGAVREFLRDAVLGDVGMPTFIGWDGVLAVASNVNWSSITLAQSATQINEYANGRVLKNTNFKT